MSYHQTENGNKENLLVGGGSGSGDTTATGVGLGDLGIKEKSFANPVSLGAEDCASDFSAGFEVGCLEPEPTFSVKELNRELMALLTPVMPGSGSGSVFLSFDSLLASFEILLGSSPTDSVLVLP